jgi:hypothetical protein
MEGMLLLSVVMAMLAGAAMVARHRSIAVGAVAVTAAARTEATEIDQEEAKSRKRKSTNEKVSASQGVPIGMYLEPASHMLRNILQLRGAQGCLDHWMDTDTDAMDAKGQAFNI